MTASAEALSPDQAAAQARRRRNRRLAAFLFIAPSVFAILAVGLIPIIYALINSFRDYNLADPNAGAFIGFANYIDVLTDQDYISAMTRTIGFLLVVVPIQLVLGMAIALLLFKPGLGFLRTLTRLSLVIPMATTFAVVGLLGRLLFNREFGAVNQLIGWLGFDKVNWLGSADNAIIAIGLMDIWQWTPFCALVLLAGLTMVPPDIEEAGRLETKSWFHRLVHIQLPYMLPAITVVLVLRTAEVLKLFDMIFTMTRGGPGQATELISVYIQRIGFRVFDQGLASAQAVFLLIVAIILSRIYIRLVYRGIEQ